jgi:hypothetical protein
MSLLRKDSKFDLDKQKGPQFERLERNSFLSNLFESGKKYFSSIHKLSYGPQGRGPETKRGPVNPKKYVDNLPR